MRLLPIVIAITASACMADTITLRDGRTINGVYMGGAARQVRIAVGDQIQTLDVSDVARIDFSAPAPAPPAPRDPPPPPPPPPPPVSRPTLQPGGSASVESSPPRATGPVQLPAGTNLVVRMIDGVDSENNSVGQTFAASLDEAVVVDGRTAIPRGADVVIRLVDSKESGTFTGRANLTLNLSSIRVNGRMVDINTQSVSQESEARGKETAKTAAGGAIIGAVIGAIAGGGKGAAVGATTGGAVGAGAQMVLKGPRVRVPSETRLTFVLDTPVSIL